MDAFIQEAELLFSLHHTNIVHMFGASTDMNPMTGAMPCMVMQLLPHTLTDVMMTGKLTSDQKHRITLGIATGLSHLRTRAPILLHCDIKPDNVLLDATMVPKLADFGLSKERKVDYVSKQGTSQHGGRGTVGYIVGDASSLPVHHTRRRPRRTTATTATRTSLRLP